MCVGLSYGQFHLMVVCVCVGGGGGGGKQSTYDSFEQPTQLQSPIDRRRYIPDLYWHVRTKGEADYHGERGHQRTDEFGLCNSQGIGLRENQGAENGESTTFWILPGSSSGDVLLFGNRWCGRMHALPGYIIRAKKTAGYIVVIILYSEQPRAVSKASLKVLNRSPACFRSGHITLTLRPTSRQDGVADQSWRSSRR